MARHGYRFDCCFNASFTNHISPIESFCHHRSKKETQQGLIRVRPRPFELDLVLEPRNIRSKWDGTGQFALVLSVNRSQERSFPMPNFARSILVVAMLVFSPWVLAQGDPCSISGMVSD